MTAPSRRPAIEALARYGTLAALIGLIVIFSILRPAAFLQFSTLVNILQQSAVLIVVATGLTICMVMFEFDLSIGFMASLAGVLVTGMMAFASIPWPLAIALTLLVGVIVGLANGLVVTELRVTAFIATLAMGTILVGINFWYNGGVTISVGVDPAFSAIGRVTMLGLPVLVWIALIVAGIAWLMLTQTAIGRHMYAIGGNVDAARLTGLAVTRVRILAFVLSAAFASLGGILIAMRFGIGFPSAGDALLLDAFTAAFLGAVTLRDGEFHVVGTVLGVLLLSVIFTGLTILGAPLYVQNWAKGGLLIGAVALSGVARRLLGTGG
jgi:ribose transport system permease protein